MSKILINQFYTDLDNLIQYGGSRKETAIRTAFQTLLNEYCKTKNFLLVPELDYRTINGKTVNPDGTVKDAIRLDYGYWESKDEYDNLDKEIEKKLAKGYPNDNILFEDSQTAVLIQQGQEIMRVPVRDEQKLDAILNAFLNYTRPEVKDFREAIEAFQADLPTILDTLRKMIDAQSINNPKFQQARNNFWQICKDSIHPDITLEDIREMIIQHILTEDIFISIFNESQFHRENNIARQLQEVIETFFTGPTKRNTLSTIERYYAVIRRTAASIYNHHEKQKFLKAVYENFYKAYNPKAADRLGIVYTPNEIVRFMIESVDYLLHQHFGKILADKDVEILDPATGTGTFITELIEYLPKTKLTYKYLNEIHCNEVSILPYYIANLNIEFTYQQKMGEYKEFANICLVDTLDHTSFADKQLDLFALTVENTARIKRQNDKTISVIIGNPPYNANQQNENDNNKNREYPAIDQRIKATYIQASKAQKTKLYDMYSRFFRWATDRLKKHGILAFITNYSFLNAKTFDGFRKLVAEDFSHIYIIDLGGDIRSGDQSGSVFNIMIGVAISFMIKKEKNSNIPCEIRYMSLNNCQNAQEKLDFLNQVNFAQIDFTHIQPNLRYDWINQGQTDFDLLLPLCSKQAKLSKSKDEELAVFKLFSLGVVTNRDEWVYDFSQTTLENKVRYFLDVYTFEKEKSLLASIHDQNLSNQIKWTRDLKKSLRKNQDIRFKKETILKSLYRPFCHRYLYYDQYLNEMRYQLPQIFYNHDQNNKVILFSSGKRGNFSVFSTDKIFGLDIFLPDATQSVPLYRYPENGEKIDNITDWGLNQFQSHYQDKNIKKIDIFHYVYAVLHYPEYRQKYEQNLKRDFPRIPFYDNFFQWVKWGKKLMDLHINYETVTPYKLPRVDLPVKEPQKTPKTLLKADKTKNSIIIDDVTTLEGIPKTAWEYKLGNRCALEWVLDQYKEKKPKDPTIAERFNTYKFADYKEQVIELLQRVCTVSVETMKIIESLIH